MTSFVLIRPPCLPTLTIRLLSLLLVALGLVASGRADQHAWITRDAARIAMDYLAPGALVVSYCSNCRHPRAELWRIKRARVVTTDDPQLFEIVLDAWKLLETPEQTEGAAAIAASRWRLPHRDDPVAVETEIDLAYIYAQQADGSFRVLADLLLLRPLDVRVATVRLPPEWQARFLDSQFEPTPQTPRRRGLRIDRSPRPPLLRPAPAFPQPHPL
jgi:hypothetical protein